MFSEYTLANVRFRVPTRSVEKCLHAAKTSRSTRELIQVRHANPLIRTVYKPYENTARFQLDLEMSFGRYFPFVCVLHIALPLVCSNVAMLALSG